MVKYIFDIMDFAYQTNRFVDRLSDLYVGLETPTYELDYKKIHDKILKPIGESMVHFGDKIRTTFCEPNDYWLQKHKEYTGMSLVVYSLKKKEIYLVAEFKFKKLRQSLALIDYNRDIDYYIDELVSNIYGYPPISRYMVGGYKTKFKKDDIYVDPIGDIAISQDGSIIRLTKTGIPTVSAVVYPKIKQKYIYDSLEAIELAFKLRSKLGY